MTHPHHAFLYQNLNLTLMQVLLAVTGYGSLPVCVLPG